MSFLILTVHKVNNNIFRFGLTEADRQIITPQLIETIIHIDLPNEEISVVNYQTFHGFGELINVTISRWILENGYTHEDRNSCHKLIFKFENNTFTFYPLQAH